MVSVKATGAVLNKCFKFSSLMQMSEELDGDVKQKFQVLRPD